VIVRNDDTSVRERDALREKTRRKQQQTRKKKPATCDL